MIGTKIAAATVMVCSVSRLDVASHMVRLTPGTVLDGMMNGNIAMPAVMMTQASVSEENRNAQAPFASREHRIYIDKASSNRLT